jgi:hypothetical protein
VAEAVDVEVVVVIFTNVATTVVIVVEVERVTVTTGGKANIGLIGAMSIGRSISTVANATLRMSLLFKLFASYVIVDTVVVVVVAVVTVGGVVVTTTIAVPVEV